MEYKILIVADDDEFLASLVSQFKDSQNIFDVITAVDGSEALNILKTTAISLVVTDVQMPVMDGFILMAYISGLYPDIPVIMMNDLGEVGAEEAALESGAVAYLEKPFTPKDLLHTISETFKKMSDGGHLTNVSLEMFIQLFEMERKTCTVRVQDKSTNNIGTLFVKNGELFNARVNELEGNEAAYEIISWKNNSVTISDTCPAGKRLIDGDNQAVLLEAAKRKEAKEKVGETTGSGGKLTNVSLETFVQLFEMEEKTCSLTVENHENNSKGILYFKNGELLDAKLNYILGKEAALKILSWERVTVEIGYDCEAARKRIDGDLQGVLLEAMRLRDEAFMTEKDFAEEEFARPAKRRDKSLDANRLPEKQRTKATPTPPKAPARPPTPAIKKPEKAPQAGKRSTFWSWLSSK